MARQSVKTASIQEMLEAELERLKELFNRGHELKVVWAPRLKTKIAGEVTGNTIYIYEEETQKALQTLKHEYIDWLITTKLINPLIHIINLLIKEKEAEIAREKEYIVDVLSSLII